MKKNRKNEAQIIGTLREAEGGLKADELCRKHGMSSPTFYAWKAKLGGMDVSEARRLRSFEEENRRLKCLVADLSLDNQMLKALNGRNGNLCGPPPSDVLAAEGVWCQRKACLQHDGQRAFHTAVL